METKFENQCDKQAAEKSLRDLKTKFDSAEGYNSQTLLHEFNRQKSEQINLIDFKRAINYLKVFGLSDIDNLAKVMDTNNNGYIAISDFVSKVKNSIKDQASRTMSTKSERTQKWGRATHTKH